MTDILPQKLILFDGICNLCNGSVRFIINRDPEARFTFASLQSNEGQRILSRFGLPTTDFDSFVYITEGHVYQRSAGALNLFKDLGGFWRGFYVLIIIPRPIRDLAYDIIARYRYRLFGKKDSCMVPTPELRKRFLG